MKMKLQGLSSMFLTAALILGGIGLVNVFLLKRGLSSGICPINTNRPFIYTAIVFSLLSFILSFFEEEKANKSDS